MSSGIQSIDFSNEEEFKNLYFRHFTQSVRIAYYLISDRQAAEDIAQEVFVKLWNKRESLTSVENVEAYIVRMTRNAALDHIKLRKDQTDDFTGLEWKEDDVSVSDQELKPAIEKALSELAPQCRLIFSLSRFEGLTNDEIADYLSISIRTVETQISNALKRFRTDLRKYFIDFLGFLFVLGEILA